MARKRTPAERRAQFRADAKKYKKQERKKNIKKTAKSAGKALVAEAVKQAALTLLPEGRLRTAADIGSEVYGGVKSLMKKKPKTKRRKKVAAKVMSTTKRKRPKKTNTRYWEEKGYAKEGMQDHLNPKPKFRVRDLEDPKKVKRKAKPKAKDPKRGLKAGEMRGTTAQRKSAFNKIAKKRAERKRRASPRYTKTKY